MIQKKSQISLYVYSIKWVKEVVVGSEAGEDDGHLIMECLLFQVINLDLRFILDL